jgi:hypothetical protein
MRIAWFEVRRFVVLLPRRIARWNRFRHYQPGQWVCCCDNVHRQIADKELPDLLVMWDGSVYDAFACVEPVRLDGMCHIPYQNVEHH